MFNVVVYLAPKVYAGKTDDYEYSRAKGVKDSISYDDIKTLLVKGESIKINQNKWYKNIGEGHITVRDEVYTLMLTENKRELFFNNDNVFVDTKPYVLSNGSFVNPITEPADTEKT